MNNNGNPQLHMTLESVANVCWNFGIYEAIEKRR